MVKYINKSAAIAEIERRIFEDYNSGDEEMEEVDEAVKGALASLRYFIDTLEVKEEIEVDLEKEIENWIENNQDTAGFYNNVEFARHFFELGLKARKEG